MNDAETTVLQLRDDIRRFVKAREWEPFHDPKNLAMSIAIEAAELMEHFQWVRSNELEAAAREEKTKQQIREELADILCYALSFANALEIDVSQAVRDKLVKNEQKYPAERYRGRYR